MANTKSNFSKSANEELINHYGLVRLRVSGSASLRLSLYSLDEINQNVLLPIPIVSKTNIEPTRLSNITEQRTKLEIRTTEINETLQISKVIVYLKPVAKSYPQLT